MESLTYPKIIFKEALDDRTAYEIEKKGWCAIAAVELPNGQRFDVFFYDPVRLAQDLNCDVNLGRTCIAEPGMIVIPSVTLSNMEKAVKELFDEGYFESLVPSDPNS